MPSSIQFSIHESKIVEALPTKTKNFASTVPALGKRTEYLFEDERAYYEDYQRSYFAVTCRKAGWDCLRHYEILANGCAPYFPDLDRCELETMALLPRDLIRETMNLKGVSYPRIDHDVFDTSKYEALLMELLAYTREHLTTRAMAKHLLDRVLPTASSILFLSESGAPDYLCDSVLTGLKQIHGARIVDVPKIEFLYANYTGDTSKLYGRGMTYSKNLPDLEVDRTDIERRISKKDFDLVIFGSVHRGRPFHKLVVETYPSDRIVYLCGEDMHYCGYSAYKNLFIREFGSIDSSLSITTGINAYA
jgi:hypothetical protein